MVDLSKLERIAAEALDDYARAMLPFLYEEHRQHLSGVLGRDRARPVAWDNAQTDHIPIVVSQSQLVELKYYLAARNIRSVEDIYEQGQRRRARNSNAFRELCQLVTSE